MHSIFQDPIYVLENNIPIDAQHYLTNMLAKPLLRIFEPILGEAKAESTLLRGEHTRTKTVVTSKISALAGFTRKKQTCLGCKVGLTSCHMWNEGHENQFHHFSGSTARVVVECCSV